MIESKPEIACVIIHPQEFTLYRKLPLKESYQVAVQRQDSDSKVLIYFLQLE